MMESKVCFLIEGLLASLHLVFFASYVEAEDGEEKASFVLSPKDADPFETRSEAQIVYDKFRLAEMGFAIQEHIFCD